jgi:NADH dehydrogenase
VRHHSDYQPLIEAGAEAAFGDLKDVASLDAACEGVDTLITTANAAGRGGEDTFDSVDDAGNRNLISAATRAGVRRFIFTSVLGSDPSSPSPLIRAKGLTEERLRASGMSFTIVQPDVYMDLLIPMVVAMPLSRGDTVVLVAEARRKHTFVAMQDVAALILAALDHEAARNQTIPFGGPEPLSWRDIVGIVGEMAGREIPFETVSPGEQLPGQPEFVSGLMASLEMYDSAFDARVTAATYGVELTPLSVWLRQSFPAAVTA